MPVKMTKRHEDQILNAIDGLTIRGWAVLSKEMLRHWYKQDRMSKTIWRDIADRLPEDWSAADVSFFEYGDDILLLAKEDVFELSEYI